MRLFSHNPPKAQAALQLHWYDWLADGLRRAQASKVLPPIRALRMSSGRELLRLDASLRTAQYRVSPAQPREDCGSDEEVADAFLFVAACNSDGYIRERALEAFSRYPGPLALAAGLIRYTDWVERVRSAARALVQDVAPRVLPKDLVQLLDLVRGLTHRARGGASLWKSLVEPRLLAPESRHALETEASDPSNPGLRRRLAFEYLIQGEPGHVPRLLNSALADRDVKLGLWALAQVESLDSLQERARLLAFALGTGHAAIRRNALRQYVGLGAQDSAQRLRAALFDSSRGVRMFAAFELQHTYNQSALPIWRAALSESEVALVSLCESGERPDVEGIAANAAEHSPTVRASILRGLWRVDSPELETQLTAALANSSTRVIRQASKIYRRGTLSLSVLTLEHALAHADGRVALSLITSSESLGKWDCLEFLLRHTVEDSDERSTRAADCIDRWLLNENRRFTASSHDQIQRLVALSQAAWARHPQRKWQSLGLILAAQT